MGALRKVARRAMRARREKAPDVRAAEFGALYESMRAQLATEPSAALGAAAARLLRDWARHNEHHGLPVPSHARD